MINSNEKKILIFDLDGTLLDTLEDLKDSLNHVLRAHAMPVRTLDEVRRFVGNGIHKLIERAVPEGTSRENIELVCRDFLDWYQDHCAIKTRPYDGILDMLERLRDAGWELAVLSNKADPAVRPLCETYFPGIFAVALGDRPGVQKKPAPDGVYEVLRLLGLGSDLVADPGQGSGSDLDADHGLGSCLRGEDAESTARAFYMGDSDVDIETAKNAGLPCISVTWGFRSEKFLLEHGATCLAHRPEEVILAVTS